MHQVVFVVLAHAWFSCVLEMRFKNFSIILTSHTARGFRDLLRYPASLYFPLSTTSRLAATTTRVRAPLSKKNLEGVR